MITDLFVLVLEGSITAGLVAAALMVLLPLANRRFAVKWSYYIWIFLAVWLLVPSIGRAGRAFVRAAGEAIAQKQDIPSGAIPVLRREPVVIELPQQLNAPVVPAVEGQNIFTLLDAASLVWLLGCVLCLLFPLCSYVNYRRRLLREARASEDAALLERVRALSRELKIRQRLSVATCKEPVSPMIMGVIRPMLILPERDYDEESLYFILKHELVHLKRHDVAVKLLLLAACAVHWFNPLVFLMRKRAVVDMELSCDERVLRGIAYADRKAYSETLFSMVEMSCGRRTYLSTQFYGGKETMKKRFQNIFTRIRKKNGLALLVCAVALTMAAGALVSCGVNDSSFAPVAFGVPKTGGAQQGMSDEELCELAKQYFAVRHGGMVPQFAVVDSTTDEGLLKIHLYDISEDDSATMTLDWYTVDRETGVGEDVNFEPVNLLETAKQTDAVENGGNGFAHMAGSWVIDFDRTENLWGSGISYGNGMELMQDGDDSFSYYIGIGNGGTGTLEAAGDALQVEVEPYEDNRSEKEILTLRYDADGGEGILMDWHGEDVYWKRAENMGLLQVKTLTFVKEGQEEQKQAQLTLGNDYGLYLPVGEWQESGPDLWSSTLNEEVSLWVTHFEDASADEAEERLAENGYSFENGRMLRENGTVVLELKLFESGDDVWGVFCRYPTEAEEGWGSELALIVDSFLIVDDSSYIMEPGDVALVDENADHEYISPTANADNEEIYSIAEQFADAYFKGSAKELKAFLADSYTGNIDVYEGTEQAQLMVVRGLPTGEELALGSELEISMEFLEGTQDSYTYLTVGFVKQEDGWKVQWYGLEK